MFKQILHIVLLSIIFITGLYSQTPSWNWSNGWASDDEDIGRGIFVDSAGFTYHVGTFSSSNIQIYNLPTLSNTGSVGTKDIMFSKLDKYGNAIWQKKIGGIGDDYAYSIAADKNGNIYLVGSTASSNCVFYGSTNINLSSSGGLDYFLAKFNANGDVLWVRTAAGTSNEELTSVSLNENYIYAGGYFSSGVLNIPSYGNLASNGAEDMLILKYDLNGNIIWAQKEGGIGNDRCNVLTAHKSGLYVGGFATTGIIYYNSTLNITKIGVSGFGSDFTYAKLDFNGNALWANLEGNNNNCSVNALSVLNGKLLIGGTYINNLYHPDFGTFPSGNSNDLFLITNNLNGAPITHKLIYTSGNDILSSISHDATHFYFTGQLGASADIGSGSNINVTSANNLFVACFDTLLNYKFEKLSTGTSINSGLAISSNHNGFVSFTGKYKGTSPGSDPIQFAPLGLNNNFSNEDYFIANFNNCLPVSGNTISSSQNICYNKTPNSIIGSAISGGNNSYNYLWQQSNDGIIWVDATGTNTLSNYSPTALTVNTLFRRVVNSCSETSTSNTIIVNVNPILNSNTSSNSINCNGNSTGSATITASGGTAPYSYLWSSAQTSSVIAGLNAGVRTVTVTDLNGCFVSNSITITQPLSALLSSTAVTHVLCNGNSTGSATITATGGTAPYSYLWSSTQTSSVIAGLNAGVRTVTVTDLNGCFVTNSITITQPLSALLSSTAVTHVLCNGNSTGSATITASGGTAPYSYLWSSGQTNSVIAGLNAGVRTVTVTDNYNCLTTNTVEITQPVSALSTSTGVINVSCYGNSTGSATIIAIGGTAPYTYLWSSTQTSSVITGLNAGVRTVTVTDNFNCVITNTVEITQPASALLATTSQTNITCVQNGYASVLVSGGTGNYTYTWQPTGGNSSSSHSLSVGNYSCVTYDENLCSITETFVISSNTLTPTLGVSGNQVICDGESTFLYASGCDTYTWSTSQNTASINISPNTTTTYSVVGTNTLNGCYNSVVQTVTVNSIPYLAVNSGTICIGESFLIIPSGADTYVISGGSFSVSPSASTIYTVIGTSPEGCSDFITSEVIVNSLPILTVSNATICSNQSYTFNPSGALTYTYSNGSEVISPTSAAVYTITGTDLNNCTNTQTVEVTVNQTPTISILSVSDNTICSNYSTLITPTGANTYTLLNTLQVGNDFTVSPTSTADYTITGESSEGCVSENYTSTLITVNTTPTISILSVSANTLCSNYSVSITPTGASTYTLLNDYSTGTNFVLWPTSTVNYTIIGISADGCLSYNNTYTTIIVYQTPTISVSNATICSGETYTIEPTSSEVNTMYILYNSSGTVTPVVSPNTTTSYSITGISVNGCESFNNVASIVNVNVTPTISISSGTICIGETFTLNPISNAYTYTYSSGSPIVSPSITESYSVTGTSLEGCQSYSVAIAEVFVNTLPTITVNNGTICSGESFTLTPTGAFTYTYSSGNNVVSPMVSSTYTIIGIDNNNCVNSQTVEITVNITPTVSVLSVSNNTICSNYSTTIIPTGANTYTLLNDNSVGTSFTLSPITTTNYSITGTSVDGCKSTNYTSTLITVNTTPTISVSNGTICAGETFTVNPTGTDNYTIQGNSFTLSPPVQTTYTINGISNAGCVSANTETITLIVNALPILSVPNGTICNGSTFNFSPIGALTYTYTENGNLVSSVVNPTTTTDYIIKGTDGNGCVSLNTICTVTVYSLPIVSANNGTICIGSSFVIQPAGATNYTYSSLTNTVTPTVSSIYTITAMDNNGCTNTQTVFVQVDDFPTLANAGTDILSENLYLELSANTALVGSGAWGNYSAVGNIDDINSPATVFNANTDGEYLLTWEISNGACPSSIDTVKVSIHHFLIPEVITPNSDGSNDYFEVKALKNTDVKFTVLNRWGNEVYSKEHYQKEFIGQNNQGEELVDDTYYYILEYNNQIQKGHFNIKRR